MLNVRECWFVTTHQGDEGVNYIVSAVNERSARMMVRRKHPERKIVEVTPVRFSNAWEVSRFQRPRARAGER